MVDPDRAGGRPVGARFLFDHEGHVRGGLAGEAVRRRARRAGRPACRPAPAERPGRRRAPADPAAHPAGDRRRGACRAGGRRHSPRRPISTSGSSTTATSTPTPSGSPTPQRIVVGPIDEVLPALEVTPQTYALIVTRGHGHDQEALYHLAPTHGVLRRADRQPPQDPAHLRQPPRAWGCPRRRWRGWRRRSGSTSARRPCPRSPSASWPN